MSESVGRERIQMSSLVRERKRRGRERKRERETGRRGSTFAQTKLSSSGRGGGS